MSLMNIVIYWGVNKDVDCWFNFCVLESGEKVQNLGNICVGNNYKGVPYTGKQENIL